jgi:large repetitive protein
MTATARRFATVAASGMLVALSAVVPAHASQPTTEEDFYQVSAGTTLEVDAPGVLANDTDPDGDPLTAEPLRGAEDGTLDLRPDGSFTYTPDPGFVGHDSFDYSARDPTGLGAIGHVFITVTQPPVANTDHYGAVAGVPRTVPEPGVLANDEGSPERAGLVRGPRHGTVTLSDSGSFTYTANPGFKGRDMFRYEAIVSGEPPDTGKVIMRVKLSNLAPDAVGDTYVTDEDTPLNIDPPGVLGNDVDPDGDGLTAELVTEPFADDFTLHSDGSFEFLPPSDFDSPVSFTYRANDGIVSGPEAVVTIDIRAVNDPPVAEDDAYELGGATRLEVPAPGVLANDSDPVENDGLIAVLRTPPSKGTVELREDGSFTYVRGPGAEGADSFTYQVNDSGGAEGGLANVQIEP